MASEMIAGSPSARASAATHASRAGGVPRALESRPLIVASDALRQVVSGYMWTATVCMPSALTTSGSCLRQVAAVASSGPISGKPPIAGCSRSRELHVQARGGRFFAREGLVERRLVGVFVAVGLVAEREAQPVDGGARRFGGHLRGPRGGAGVHVQADRQRLAGARQQAVQLAPEAGA